MKIKIIGLGWYGLPLAQELKKQGHEVSGTTRTLEKASTIKNLGIVSSQFSYPDIPNDLNDHELIILNIPPFSEELSWLKKWPWNFAKNWVIFISSTSVYPQPDSASAQLLKDQEEWIKASFNNWTILRFGGLLGGERHPGKYLSGKSQLLGRLWPVNLLHLDDAIGVTMKIIEARTLSKTFEVVSSEHPTREEFYTKYCRDHHLPLPQFDQNDLSQGKLVPNDEIKKIYSFKFSL